MYKGKRIGIVVPAYNEEKQIRKVIDTMPETADVMVIVDDCSRDRTSDVVRECIAREPRVQLIRHEVNQGVGGAIASGYKWCRDNGIDVAVVMAGDGQMEPRDFTTILDPVVDGQADYSKANRLFFEDSRKDIPKIRFIGNSVLSLLTKIASGYWHVSDSQTGYTAINRTALEVIDWDSMYKRYGQPNDLLVRLNVFNFRVKDVYIRPTYGVGEESKLKVRRAIFSLSWLLLKLFFWRLNEKYFKRDFHPLILFYAMGLGCGVVATALFVRLIVLWTRQGAVPEMTALAWMFMVGLGLQSLFFAMLFDRQETQRF